TNTSWALPAAAMPRNDARVVCTLCETIATLAPTRALISVDLPTLGAPISAMKPQRVGSAIEAVRLDAGPGQHGGGGGLLGGACGAAEPFGRGQMGKLDGDAELGIVGGAFALDLAVGRRRQPARLRPFLQHGLGIAQRAGRSAHALAPQPLDHGRRRRI